MVALAALFPLLVPVVSSTSAPLPNLLQPTLFVPMQKFITDSMHNALLLKMNQNFDSKIGCGISSTVFPDCASWVSIQCSTAKTSSHTPLIIATPKLISFFCVRLFCSRLCKKLLPRLVMAFAALFPLVVPVGSPPSAPLPNLLPCPPDHFNANTQHNFFLHKKLLKIVQKNSSKIGCGTSSTVSPGCASWQLGFHPLLHCQTCSYSPFLCQCKNSLHISCTRLFC